MTDLLRALNWKVSTGSRICLVAFIGIATTLVLLLGLLIEELTGAPVVILQCAVWLVWLTWLGIIFPRNRRRDEDAPTSYPYRRAFMREILFGVSLAFSQLMRPAVNGILIEGREIPLVPSAAVGLPLLLAGAGIVGLGVATLGVARTLFVYEYIPTDRPVTTSGIFQVLRHPMFLGGAMISLGLAVCTGSQVAIELGIINACIVPIYVQLEDRRCCATLGLAYGDYRAAVGGVIPRRRSTINRSALAHQAAGSIEPTIPRNLVTTQ
jgi:protein-S-isoprenylcysteine O-methyltransferase Ste14